MEGAEGQYSGMQIGQLQDEEDEAANILQDDSSESFRSSIGMLINKGEKKKDRNTFKVDITSESADFGGWRLTEMNVKNEQLDQNEL